MDARQAMTPRPPRLAEVLLRSVVPSGTTGLSIVGDLNEEFAERAASRPWAARVWYWRQATAMIARYAVLARDLSDERGGLVAAASDLRASLRMSVAEPGTSTLVVITLAAAIGAATVGFSFADFALLRGMPVDDPDRVVWVHGVDPRQADGRAGLSLANYRDLRDRLQSLERMAAFRMGRIISTDRGIPTSLQATRASADHFAALGQGSAAGRLFAPGDDRAGAPPVVVLSHRYWTEMFSASPAAIGQTMNLDGRAHTMVGVASPDVEVGTLSLIDVYVPLTEAPDWSRTERAVSVVARLAPGYTLASANAEITTVAAALAIEYPEANEGWRAAAIPILEAMAGRGFWLIVTLFLVAVTLVIAIACANVANVMLARMSGRRRELAVRAALGASRLRIVRLSVLEGVWLSLAAGLLAIPAAEIGLRAIRSVDAEPALQQMRLDWHEASFAVAAALVSPLLFALVPALSATRVDLRTTLQSGTVRSGRAGGRARTALVILQLTLAVTLLMGAGVAVRTAINLSRVEPGLRTDRVLTFDMELQPREYPGAGDVRATLDAVRRTIRELPGVESVHLLDSIPVLRDARMVAMPLSRAPVPHADDPWALVTAADADTLSALRVPLLAGRWLSETETGRVASQALVGRETAERYFGSVGAAVGRSVTLRQGDDERELEIVGVADNVLTSDLERGPVPRVWTPLGTPRRVSVMVLTRGAPSDLSAPIRAALATVAPMVPAESLESYADALWRQQASNYVLIAVFAAFALLSLGLAGAGLYGVVSQSVGQRTAEFGTRFALGAQVQDVLGLVLRESSRSIAVGLALGIGGGLALTTAMRETLYLVEPADPISLAAVAGLLAGVALVASVVPAIRATRVDLVEAIRSE